MDYELIYKRLMGIAKYRNWEEGGISRRQYSRERHHIKMLSLGGEDIQENRVVLDRREHFIAHRLLSKMYPEGSREYISANNAMNVLGFPDFCKNSHQFVAMRDKMNEVFHNKEIDYKIIHLMRQDESLSRKNMFEYCQMISMQFIRCMGSESGRLHHLYRDVRENMYYRARYQVYKHMMEATKYESVEDIPFKQFHMDSLSAKMLYNCIFFVQERSNGGAAGLDKLPEDAEMIDKACNENYQEFKKYEWMLKALNDIPKCNTIEEAKALFPKIKNLAKTIRLCAEINKVTVPICHNILKIILEEYIPMNKVEMFVWACEIANAKADHQGLIAFLCGYPQKEDEEISEISDFYTRFTFGELSHEDEKVFILGHYKKHFMEFHNVVSKVKSKTGSH